ncbi:hypothetical protein L1987_71741 [Smallanthus sonchifolius]|uniref:Uncharacterized protein n=1 Tax=Smallanthus sonchifolius TaxID=185202 RepID=A0ACB9ATX5_9ASTR|nr:hypothetical protein L1987_71741 [Smallanthus sonchifolius]
MISNDSRVPLSEAMEEKQHLLKIVSKEDDNEAHEFSFTFKFPTFEEFIKTHKNSSQLHDFSEHMDSSEVSLEDSEVLSNSNGFGRGVHVQHDDPKEDYFEDQECVFEQRMVDGLNLKNIVEVEEKEEKLQKVHDESVYVYSSPDSDMYSIGSSDLHPPTFDLHLKDGFLSDEYFELEFKVEDENDQHNWTGSDFLYENDFGAKSVDGSEENLSNDTTKLESLREDQELIEQLKLEIKKVKAIGLPTIFEESESPPKVMEDLKPWKIEEVYQNGGGKIGEVHKFYKSYRDRMRKFDVFSYQKMYAIGLLQLKDPHESSSSSISSVPETTTLFTQSFTTNKGKKHENDPKMKFIQELQSDLEIVYVGQMCLSWEILHWQYEKALDIWESDPRGVRRFNDIAGEFQQFQVLMQRFIEDEPFQGPRIQNYAKTRCVYRNLLQVPEIREDQLKNKKARSEVVHDITSDALVEILEESIRIFWRFVRADRYKRQTPVEFQGPEDSQLFLDLQKDLHKKERKLKEQLRSGNGIFKKLRCREDEIEDQVLYFFCEVDMKLVSRVLQMSNLTRDQLLWCHNKLSKILLTTEKTDCQATAEALSRSPTRLRYWTWLWRLRRAPARVEDTGRGFRRGMWRWDLEEIYEGLHEEQPQLVEIDFFFAMNALQVFVEMPALIFF